LIQVLLEQMALPANDYETRGLRRGAYLLRDLSVILLEFSKSGLHEHHILLQGPDVYLGAHTILHWHLHRPHCHGDLLLLLLLRRQRQIQRTISTGKTRTRDGIP